MGQFDLGSRATNHQFELTNSNFESKMEDIRERFESGKEAFEELFSLAQDLQAQRDEAVEQVSTLKDERDQARQDLATLEAEREEVREQAKARVEKLYDQAGVLRQKNKNLKTKYLNLLAMFNELTDQLAAAEGRDGGDPRNRSDSSSGEDSDPEDKNCSLM